MIRSITIAVLAYYASLVSGQFPNECESRCVNQNAVNGYLYAQMFTGTMNQIDYLSSCNDIYAAENCMKSCQGIGSNCLTASLPLYDLACSAGYQTFDKLNQCMNQLGLTQNDQQCQQQCATYINGGKRKRRQVVLPQALQASAANRNYNFIAGSSSGYSSSVSTVQDPLINGNSFCVASCLFSRSYSQIQSSCDPWVSQFVNTAWQVYGNLRSVSESCLSL